MENNSTLTSKDVLKLFYNLPDRAYEFDSYKVVPFACDPLGYLSEHSQLHIHVKSDDKEEKVLQFFMKSMPISNEFHKKYINEIQVFEKEALLYKDVLNDLQTYSDKQLCAKYHLTNVKSYIVLEDLSAKGYSTVKDKSVMLDLQQCKCVIETLARFHAASIIMEEKRSSSDKPYRLFDHFANSLFETTFSYVTGHPRNHWLNTTIAAVIDLGKLVSPDRHRDIELRLLDLKEAMRKYVSRSETYRNVVNHADLWSNNFMFKYNEECVPEHCILVDFQMARYVPPAFDLLTFLYLNTSAEFCATNFPYLANFYYQIFASQLETHGVHAATIYSKVLFLESCEFYRVASLLESAMFGTIVYLNGDFSKDMLTDQDKFNDFMLSNRSTFVCDLFKNDCIYRKRITNVLTQLFNLIL